ncbi:ATP-binding protein [Nonomuraea sp. MTCD27]|uniref:ATP-binding protein n=1 Tax=Nonomuraea sp. MTCD27 TaxID=1676747 RepID=UPI0035BFCD14
MLADTGRRGDAEWVTAELVSNTLRHSRSGQARGFFVVEVLRGADVARIVVYDLGGGAVPDFSQAPGSVPVLAEHGRGLAGVAQLAIRYGVAGDPNTGHAVWAELALSTEVVLAVPAGDAAVAGEGEPKPGGSHELMPITSGAATKETGRVVTGVGPSPVDCGGTSSDLAAGLDPSLFGEGALGQEVAQVSAFGQEPWAQLALAGLRRDWPEWAFLVVRYRWLAMRGPQVVISAANPEELRQALPPIPRNPIPAEGGSAASVQEEHAAAESAPPVPTLSELLGTQSYEGRTGAGPSSPPASASAWGAGVGGVHAGEGAGTGLSGMLAAVAPLSAVVAAERSGTGTWAVVNAGPPRVTWWPHLWPVWRRGSGRGRSRAGARVPGGGRGAGLSGLPGESGPRHRRVRSKPLAVAAVIAA